MRRLIHAPTDLLVAFFRGPALLALAVGLVFLLLGESVSADPDGFWRVVLIGGLIWAATEMLHGLSRGQGDDCTKSQWIWEWIR